MWVAEVSPGGELRTLPSVLGPDDAPEVDGARLSGAPLGVPFTVASTDGGAGFRVLVQPGGAGPRLAFATPLDDTDAAVRRLTTVLLWGGLGILTVLGLSGWWVWRLGLRPIREMTDAAERMAHGDRDLRVPVATAGTEAAMLADALNAMIEARHRNEEQLRRFVGDASHELRTPLTSVRGYAELYQRGALGDPADLDDAMRRILQESDRMAVLVEDLLLLARLDQGRPLDAGPVDLAAVLDDAAADARAVSPQRPVSVDVQRPLMVLGDENRLRQVVAGLVANALVHTDAAVHLRGWPDRDGTVGVSVRDEGPGMDARTAEHAFDRFFRGDPARSRHTGGSGLGLAIASSVVEAHGGRVSLRSAPGEGCTVELHLPGGSSFGPAASGTPAGTVQG
jgi:two-component system OmpR family sensor kinase